MAANGAAMAVAALIACLQAQEPHRYPEPEGTDPEET